VKNVSFVVGGGTTYGVPTPYEVHVVLGCAGSRYSTRYIKMNNYRLYNNNTIPVLSMS
jgi:hypothetical protein